MKMRSKSLDEVIRQVESWNDKNPVGTPVELTRDNGETFFTFTRASAAILCGQPVVWLEGISGCYALGRVRAMG